MRPKTAMKLSKVDAKNVQKGLVELPAQFNEPLRKDLIKRAVMVLQNNGRQKYGADARAGKRASAKLSRRRRNYKGSYGHGISRVPRKIITRRGTRFFWTAAFAPGTVKGRRAHPPKSSKIWEQKINKKENRKAIRSAIAATIVKEIVEKRGHLIPEKYPFVADSSIERLSKTKEIVKTLKDMGFGDELKRGSKRKIRAGKGKMRGRKYKQKKSLLIVIGADCPLIKASSNIPGIDVIKVNELNAETLAPGSAPGRITLWSESAISKLAEEKMFI